MALANLLQVTTTPEEWDAERENRFSRLIRYSLTGYMTASESLELNALKTARDALESDGACLTCLMNGSCAFPLDPRYHEYRTGHAPVTIRSLNS